MISLKDALYVQSHQKVAENQYWRIYPLWVYFEYEKLRGTLQFDLSYSAEMTFLIFIYWNISNFVNRND